MSVMYAHKMIYNQVTKLMLKPWCSTIQNACLCACSGGGGGGGTPQKVGVIDEVLGGDSAKMLL